MLLDTICLIYGVSPLLLPLKTTCPRGSWPISHKGGCRCEARRPSDLKAKFYSFSFQNSLAGFIGQQSRGDIADSNSISQRSLACLSSDGEIERTNSVQENQSENPSDRWEGDRDSNELVQALQRRSMNSQTGNRNEYSPKAVTTSPSTNFPQASHLVPKSFW